MALNAKQKLFVQEYLVDKNATRAAKVAGYAPKAAYAMGAENLRKPQIAQAIAEGLALQTQAAQARAAQRGVTKERWLKELELIAFADMDDFAEITEAQSGNSQSVSMITTADRKKGRGRAIKKISETSTQHGGSIGLELHNKLPALELIAKAHGWVKDIHEHQGEGGGPMVVLTLPSNGSEAPPKTKPKKEK